MQGWPKPDQRSFLTSQLQSPVLQQYVFTGACMVGLCSFLGVQEEEREVCVSCHLLPSWWIWCFSNFNTWNLHTGKGLAALGVSVSRNFASTVSVVVALDFAPSVPVNCQSVGAQDLSALCHHHWDEEERWDLNIHPYLGGFQGVVVLISSGWEVSSLTFFSQNRLID